VSASCVKGIQRYSQGESARTDRVNEKMPSANDSDRRANGLQLDLINIGSTGAGKNHGY